MSIAATSVIMAVLAIAAILAVVGYMAAGLVDDIMELFRGPHAS